MGQGKVVGVRCEKFGRVYLPPRIYLWIREHITGEKFIERIVLGVQLIAQAERNRVTSFIEKAAP